MKSEQEFIADLWIQIDIVEMERQQQELARQRDRMCARQNLVIYLMMGLISIFILLLIHLQIQIAYGAIFMGCLIMLMLGFALDTYINNVKGNG